MSKLSQEQWRTILDLSERTADLPAGERLLYLESVCSSAEMVREVLSVVQDFHPAADATSRVGSRVGRFAIKSYLGSGGVGDVYSATDTELGRTVALKFLTPAAGERSGATERFIREARTTSALNHPNIVTVHEIIRSDDTVAIVMEYVEGKALRQICGAPASLEQTVQIGRQIALALAAAHSEGIVHRDIKPENVIVRSDGSLKVLDFGLATWAAAQGQNATGLSSSHLFAGTWRYMSPEQARGEPVTSATDIYSLGLVLYELSTGRQPYAQESLETQLRHSERKLFPPPSRHRASLPQQVDELIAAMLADNGSARPSAARVSELMARLERLPYPARSPGWLVRAAIGGSLLAGCLFVYLSHGFKEPPLSSKPLLPIPISVDPGYKSAPSFSPDGKRIAYQWERPGKPFQVYVQDLPGENGLAGEPVRVTESKVAETNPAWSPDGKSIVLIREQSNNSGELVAIRLQSHRERKLTGLVGRPLLWTPNGHWLLTSENRKGHFAIVLISPATGARRPLTDPAPNEDDESPSIAPDGSRLAFVARRFGQGPHLAQLSLDRDYNPIGKPAALRWQAFWSANIDNPIWTANSRGLLFIAAPDGILRIWRSRDGSQPELVNDLGENISGMAFSPDHRRLAYTRNVDDTNIWRLNLKGLASSQAGGGAATEMIASSRMDQRPAVSPDGTKLAYESNRSGFSEIWLAGIADGKSWPLTHMRGVSGSPRWSHDGKWIVFDSRTTGRSKLFRVSSSGGKAVELTGGEGNDSLPVWSADDKLIYFCSNRSGKFQIWAVPANGGAPTVVTKNMAAAPEPSPDGRFLFYVNEWYAPSTLWRMNLSNGAASAIAEDVCFREVAVGREAVYYVTQGDLALHALNGKTGKSTTIGKMSSNSIGGMSLSPDERELYFAELDHSGDELLLVNNFQ